jgi:hypothetical protein
MTTIRIEADILRDRELRLRHLSLDLTGAVNTNFNAGVVDTAYDELHNLWKESQNEIHSGIDRVANLLRDIREAFESVEEQLVNALPPAQAPKAGGW